MPPPSPLPSVDVRGGVVARTHRRAAAAAALLVLGAAVAAQVATAAVLPALTREVGLADWQAGAVTSSSAAVVVLSSAWWGRRADRGGPRAVLLVAVGAGVLGTAGVAAVVSATQALPPAGAWVALLVARGVVFGTAVAAAGPATQVVLVAGSRTGDERVAWIARAGAVRGVATTVGAGFAAGLGALGPAVPVLAAVVLLAAAGAAVVLVRGAVPAPAPGPAAADAGDAGDAEGAGGAAGRGDRVTPEPAPLTVGGVRAALAASAAVFLALSLVQGSVGFLVQDRYAPGAGRATALTGALLLAAGLGSVLAQGVLVPRLRWRPWRLVRAGGVGAVVALVVYLVPVPVPVLLVVAAGFGTALGAAAAGCTAAASVAVGPGSQGDVAGLVNAANAGTFVVGPLLAAAAYGVHPALPGATALVAALVVLVAAARSGR